MKNFVFICFLFVTNLYAGVDFDANGDYVTLGSGASLDDLPVMTIAAWINPRTMGQNQLGVIMAKNTGSDTAGWRFNLDSNASRRMGFQVDYTVTDVSGVSLNLSISTGTWQHVAVTWDGTTNANGILFYKNGVLIQTTGTGTGTRVPDLLSIAYIGDRDAGNRSFDGIIEDLRIFNRVLTASEIESLGKSNERLWMTDGSIGYWPMDEGNDGTSASGQTCVDRSGTGNTGVATNGTWRSAVYINYP